MGELWQGILDKLTGVSSKPASMQELAKQRELQADAAEAAAITRGEYGQAMTPWGQLTVYDPLDPRFHQQVKDVWADKRATWEKRIDGVLLSKGVAKHQIAARMSRAWDEVPALNKPPALRNKKQPPRDRQKAIRQLERTQYDIGARPNRSPKTQDAIEAGQMVPKRFQADRS